MANETKTSDSAEKKPSNSTEKKSSASAEKKVSKTEMVRQAMKVGKKRKSIEIQKWIQTKFNTTLLLTHISTIKSNLKKYKLKKPGATPTEVAEPAPAPRRKTEPDLAPSLSLEEMRVVKDLVGRMGQEKVKEAVELFG